VTEKQGGAAGGMILGEAGIGNAVGTMLAGC